MNVPVVEKQLWLLRRGRAVCFPECEACVGLIVLLQATVGLACLAIVILEV